MSVRDDLEEARTAVAEFQRARGRPPARPAPADRRSALGIRCGRGRADDAAALARRRVPAGDRRELPAVRVIAEGVDGYRPRSSIRPPGLVGTFGLQHDPATGGFDLAPLRQATEIVATADRVVTDLHDEIESIDTGPRSARCPRPSTSSTRCSPRPRRRSRR